MLNGVREVSAARVRTASGTAISTLSLSNLLAAGIEDSVEDEQYLVGSIDNNHLRRKVEVILT
jgi:hypothetical protein